MYYGLKLCQTLYWIFVIFSGKHAGEVILHLCTFMYIIFLNNSSTNGVVACSIVFFSVF